MNIVNMSADHVADVAKLEKLCFRDPWSENSIAAEVNNSLSLWLVALEGHEVVGYIGSQTVMDESDMMNVAVHPDHRRRGIGQQLICELTQRLVERGSVSLTLEVRASNEPAKQMYEKLGFALAGRRPNYYRNPKEDALILRKML